MQLHTINLNGNKYCGPSVISAIAGIGSKEAAAIIREANGKESVRGTHAHELIGALGKLGYGTLTIGRYTTKNRSTLRTWAKDHARGNDVYLVLSGNHWILVQGRHAMCGKTKVLVAIAAHPNVRTFVTEAYRISKLRSVDPATVIPTRVVTGAGVRRKAQALARKYGVWLEKLSDDPDSSIGVWQKKGFHDPYDDGHYFYEWSEILERVKEYVAIQVSTETDPKQGPASKAFNALDFFRELAQTGRHDNHNR